MIDPDEHRPANGQRANADQHDVNDLADSECMGNHPSRHHPCDDRQ
jgi:hypothetical protein